MATAARFASLVFGKLLFAGAVLLCGAMTPAVQAGFELRLDTTSLRQSGDHYSIDVIFNGSDQINLNGIVATVTSKNEGLKFLGILHPDQGAIFDPSAYYDSDGESSGAVDELWHATVFANGDPVPWQGEGVAFRLDFSVSEPGEYDIDFVNVQGSDEDVTMFLQGPREAPQSVEFDQLTSQPFIVSTPEPGSFALLATALGGLGFWRWRHRTVARLVVESAAGR